MIAKCAVFGFSGERRRLFICNALINVVQIPISLKLFEAETLKYRIGDREGRTSISYEFGCTVLSGRMLDSIVRRLDNIYLVILK